MRSSIAALLSLVMWLGCGADDAAGPSADPSTSSSGATGGGGTGSAGAGGDGGVDSAATDALVAAKLAEARIPGLSTCLVKAGAVVWCKGYGFANIEEDRAATPDTVYLIASISKTITTVALMQLRDEGGFALDDDVAPSLAFPAVHPSSSEPLTFRRLLTHTAGVRDNWDIINGFYTYGSDTTVTLEQAVAGYFDPGGAYYDSANFTPQPPGGPYEYANMGIALAGYMIEALTTTDLEAWSKSRIFTPLAMSRSAWWLADFAREDLAMPYGASGPSAFVPYGHYTFADYPDGGMRTSATDLGRFMAMLTLGGTLEGTTVLDAATVSEMLSPQLPPPDDTQALGFYHYSDAGEDWVGHSGGEQGVATDMFWRTSDGLGFVVLMNGDWPVDPTPIYEIEAALVALAESL